MPAKRKNLSFQKILLPLLALSAIFNLYFLVHQYLPPLPKSENETNHSTTSGQVKTIIDGNTFDLTTNERIKLAGADAPEITNGCLGEEAKQKLQGLVKDKKVRLEIIDKDNLDRQIAYVFLDETLVDEIMVEAGLAQAESNNSSWDPQLLSAQEEAQKLALGIWSSECQPQQDCLIKGNVSKDGKTKTYHLPGCYNYDKIVVKEEEGDQWFCTQWEAQWAGFTPSQDCP
jgi:endonuclease YncB( thermonuclease family)